MCRRIVEAQGQNLEVARWSISLYLAEIGAIPDSPNDIRPVVFDPRGRAGERMQESLLVSLPGTDVPIEIVLPIASSGLACARGDGILLRMSIRRSNNRLCATQQESGPNAI